jgi:hypothetical protein
MHEPVDGLRPVANARPNRIDPQKHTNRFSRHQFEGAVASMFAGF